MVIIIHCF